MNLLFVNYEYPPIGAGAASASKHIAEEMTRQGHFVGILTSSFGKLKGESKEGSVIVYRCKSLRKKQFQSNIFEMLAFMVSSSFALGKLIKKWKIDHLVVFFSFPGGPIGLVGKLFYHKPFVVSLRGSDVPGAEPGLNAFHFFLKPLRKLILRKSDAVVANSNSLMQLAYKSDPMQYLVIPNGVDTTYFYPLSESENDPQTVRFLFVGRLQRQKNLFFLFDCISELKKKTTKSFVFSIVGDGPIRKELEAYAIKLGINEHIEFHGWLDKSELLPLYQKSDCILNLSFNEGMSNVLLEAMACGLVAIASNVAGNDVLIEHNWNGFLFDLKKPEKLIELLLKVVDDRKLIKPMGIKARMQVVEKHSWQRVAAEYIKLLNEKESE